MKTSLKVVVVACLLVSAAIDVARAQAQGRLAPEIVRRAASLESRVVAWRRDIHQNPELSNREFRAAKLVAEHSRKLGLEVKTDVAHTGVVALLRGGKP